MDDASTKNKDQELIREVKAILDDIDKRLDIARVNHEILKRLTKDANRKEQELLKEYRSTREVRNILFKKPTWWKLVNKEPSENE